MAKRNFPNSEYGPMALRRMLRRRLLPGERIVGWGPAVVNPPAWALVAGAGLTLIPIAGHLLMMSMLSGYRRFVVLTDTRILVLTRSRLACDVGGRGVRADVPLHSVDIRRGSKGHHFKVATRKQPRAEVYAFDWRTQPSLRLIEGMRMLSEPLAEG